MAFIEGNFFNESIKTEILKKMKNISNDNKYIILESPEEIIFYDFHKDEGLSLSGKLNSFKENIGKEILDSIAEENNYYFKTNKNYNDIELYDIPNANTTMHNYFEDLTFRYISSNKNNICTSYDFKEKVNIEHEKHLTYDKWEYNNTLLPHDEYLIHKTDNGCLNFNIIKDKISDKDYSLNISDKNRHSNVDNQNIPYEKGGTLFYKGSLDDLKEIVVNTIEYIDNTREYSLDNINTFINQNNNIQLEVAKKAGHVQGVCECVVILGDNHDLAKKLMTETGVTKDIAKKFANPETYKALEQGIFAPKQEQQLEQTQGVKR